MVARKLESEAPMKVLMVVGGIFFLLAAAQGCGSDSNSTGQAGTGGGAGTTGSAGITGQAGTGGGAGGTGGGDPNFVAVGPCNSEVNYVNGQNTIVFGVGTPPMAAYDPKCLKVSVGTAVTFMGDFGAHPMSPSTRGTQNSPITRTAAGTSATFTFSTPGQYAYFCEFHGPSDNGMFMAGVVWVD
jgi:plastocyanin